MAIIDNSLLVLHAKSPQFFGTLKDATHTAEIKNVSCGDSVNVFAVLENGELKELGFQSVGCMLCRASTSILLTNIHGKKIADFLRLTDEDLLSMLGSEEILYGRRKCALLGLEAVRAMFA